MRLPKWSDLRWSRGATLMGIGGFAVSLGLAASNAGAVALGIALVCAPAVVGAILRATVRGIVVTRTALSSASEGDRVMVTMRIENRSRFGLSFARITEIFAPESLGLTQAVELTGRLDRGRTSELSYFGICRRPRGIYPHGPITLEATDPFEWFTVTRRYEQITEFKVYPRLRKTALPDKVFASVIQPDARDRTLRLNESEEFFAVRDYLPGDPIKRIHWSLFARRDFPVVREYLPSVQHAVVLFLDVGRQLRFSGAQLSNFESSVRFAASLASRVIRAGLPFELRCGSTGTFDVRAGQGRGQLAKVLDVLVRVRTRTDDWFIEALGRNVSKLPNGATIVVALHPYLLGNRALARALVALVARGLRVACIAYGVRTDIHTPESIARHRGYLRGLKSAGIELWNETGAPLLPSRALVAS
jgi:uncharacterized protein (DUF58 family)